MGIGELCRVLSRPFASEDTREAAGTLLQAPDPSAVLDRSYNFLVWQRTLRTMLGHLADGGADLATLQVSPQRIRRTFPAGYKPVWDVDVDQPVSAARLVEIYATHRRLLAAPIIDLADAGCEGFTLLSGRAFEARYPTYDWRVEFDTDLVSPDMESAMQVTESLVQAGYELDTVRIRRLGEAPDATVEIRQLIDGHRISVGVLVGGYHGYRAAIHDRADVVSFRGRTVRVPSPEDLLLMLAARIERKRVFALVNLNDAAIVLTDTGRQLDWDHVVDGARAAGLGVTLAVVLELAAPMLPSPVVPNDVPAALVGSQRSSHALAQRAAAIDTHLRTPTRAQRAIKRLWLADVDLRRARRHDTPNQWSRLALRLQRPILKNQVRRAQGGRPGGGVDRIATRLRTRSGALCEVAPHLGSEVACVRRLGSWHGSRQAAALLASCAAYIAPPEGPHLCRRLVFELSDRRGT